MDNLQIVPTGIMEQPQIAEAIRGLMGQLHSPLSRRFYMATITDYLTWAEERGGNLAASLSEYLAHQSALGLQASSINTKRVHVKAFLKWLVETGVIQHSDYLRVESLVKSFEHHGKKAGRWITGTQLFQLISLPDPTTQIGRRDRAVLAMLIGTGMRRNEIVNLKWNQIKQVGGVWVVENLERKKSRTQAHLPLPDFAITALQDYGWPEEVGDKYVFVSYFSSGAARKSLTSQTVYNIIIHYSTELGVTLSPHDARRSFSKFLHKEKGWPLDRIQQHLGHSSIKTTELYVNSMLDLDEAKIYMKDFTLT